MLNYLNLNNIVSALKLFLDIGVVAIVFYYCLKVVKNNSRTIQIVKGIIFIFLVNWLSQILELRTIEFITTQFLNWGFLVVFIIFQPELRSLLEKLGKTTVFSSVSVLSVNQREKLVEELVQTCITLSANKTGALMSLEQTNSMDDFIRTGTQMNSEVTTELLCSIFVPGTPLHDGAVIIRGDKIACASAYFPPTVKSFPSSYGARHRAAVGISEISDCVTIIVSEETGNISIAFEGRLSIVTPEELRIYLLEKINKQDENDDHTKLSDVVKNMTGMKTSIKNDKIEVIEIVMKKKRTPKKKEVTKYEKK